MIAIDMDEAQGCPTRQIGKFLRGQLAGIERQWCEAITREPMGFGVGQQSLQHLATRPGKQIEPIGALALANCKPQRNKEAALEGADLRHRAANPKLALPTQQMPADRRRESRRKSPHLVVPVGEITIDRENAGFQGLGHGFSWEY